MEVGGVGRGTVVAPDVANAEPVDPRPLGQRVFALDDDHVAAVAAAAFEITPGRGAAARRRHHFEEVAADRQQRVLQSELADPGIAVTDLKTEHGGDFGDRRVELRSDKYELT